MDYEVYVAQAGTILIVDDEAPCREQMREILEREGYEVVDAEDYNSATAVFAEHRDRIGLLIADVSLPGPNGCEIYKTLSQEKPDLRVLFVSGHVGAEVCRRYGVEINDMFFLRKPFEAAELAARVKAIWKSRGAPPAISFHA